MIIKDDRTPEQKETHHYLVIGTDSFMSGWGKARNGMSYAVWACKPEHYTKVERWVASRSEMKRIRTVVGSYRPRGVGHTHIYVVENNHSSLK